MPDIPLKYGCNPNQPHARIVTDGPCPLEVVGGTPSYINALDALQAWQLVAELAEATGKPAAASFKHVSPAGAAVAAELDDDFRRAHFYGDAELSPLATAYARARSSDRQASFGDFIAVSDTVDASLANLIKPEVSDGIIAPGYDDDALEILKAKKAGKYVVFRMDRDYRPDPEAVETRTLMGLRLEQSRNDLRLDAGLFADPVTSTRDLPDDAAESLVVASIALKYTQSNSVALALRGQAVGIGAGQQSRIACVRLACDKTDRFLLKQHPRTLALPFPEGTPRPEKVNLAEQFVMWDQLGPKEHARLRDTMAGPIEPISPEQRHAYLADVREPRLRQRRLLSLQRQHRPPRPEQRPLRRPGRRLETRRRRHRRRRRIRHDHVPHRRAIVYALMSDSPWPPFENRNRAVGRRVFTPASAGGVNHYNDVSAATCRHADKSRSMICSTRSMSAAK